MDDTKSEGNRDSCSSSSCACGSSIERRDFLAVLGAGAGAAMLPVGSQTMAGPFTKADVPRGESPVFAPTLLELIRVEGAIDKRGPKDVPVRNLRFCGLTFKHGERYTLTKGDAGLQHDWDMLDKDNALVRLRGTDNSAVERCSFLHSGSGAIRVDLHGIRNRISSNHIEHMGGGGILLCGYGPGTKDVNKKNLVYNNHIHHVGEIYWHSPGIYVCQSGENRVANNLIHHTNYTALIISGTVTRFFVRQDKRESVRTIRWHEIRRLPANPTLADVRPYLHTRNNLVELNEIHHAMQILGDGNGIYIRGAGPGNVIRRNVTHQPTEVFSSGRGGNESVRTYSLSALTIAPRGSSPRSFRVR